MKRERKSQSNIIAKECIVSALLKLIYEKPLSSITISELTKRAGVSRMTFYRNYESKEDVFISQLEEIFERYEEESDSNELNGIYYDKKHLMHCFSYFYEYREFIEGLIHCGLGNIFIKHLNDYISKKWLTNNCDYIQRYRLIAFVGIIYSTYMSWTQDKYSLSLEGITEVTYNICKNGLK